MTAALGVFGLAIVCMLFYGMYLIAQDSTEDVHHVGREDRRSNLSPLDDDAPTAGHRAG